jgi:methylphosphotriester-DNA--protein-cysteine methyltransferase
MPESAFMMTGIGVQHRSESVFTFDRNGRSRWAGIRSQHFRTITGMSPVQFQKRLRLQEARQLMLNESASAAAASALVGYESASQFNREYRRLFGAPPQRDVRNMLSQ